MSDHDLSAISCITVITLIFSEHKMFLTFYLIEMPFNAFANRADPDSTEHEISTAHEN